jgi:hypothetical protein
MECKGNGECFEQIEGGYKQNLCSTVCVLQKCSTCLEERPEWILVINNGQCLQCKMNWNFNCKHCGTRLRPVGHSRIGGKDHPDWGSRRYHKKCLKYVK